MNKPGDQKGNQKGQEHAEASDQYEVRLEKLQELIVKGESPYRATFKPEHHVGNLLEIPADRYQEEQIFTLAGRVRSKRIMGKAGFMDIEDASGRMQLYASGKDLDKDGYDLFKHLDLGDVIGVSGFLFTTKTGQTTLHLKSLKLLSKCIRPLPVVKEADGKVFDAFSDKEQRYRMRYVDLIVNPDSKKAFITRSRIIQEVRHFLTEKGFLEVETPMMHPIPGGAAARPFITHHNTLDMDLYLRIAPELYLKRLIVGGFEKVFELNRNFRNEGISFKHNPEFTMLELYQAYSDMQGMLELCEEMIVHLVKKFNNGNTVIQYGDQSIDMTAPWKRMTYLESIEHFAGVKLDPKMTIQEAKDAASGCGVNKEDLDQCQTPWQVAEFLFDEKVEAKLIQPVFITRFPTELSPLAKASLDDPEFVDRFEPYVVGREIGNAFSELNDPFDQKARFEEQVKAREAGDEEGGYMDLDYIRALEYGLPPTGGMGIGIDRLVMLLTNTHTIRDTILFPQMRPEKEEA